MYAMHRVPSLISATKDHIPLADEGRMVFILHAIKVLEIWAD
jgi:hypothetical protein